jgi:N-acyl amino acid synthase FeeM
MGYHSDIRYSAEKLKSELTSRSRSDGTDLTIQKLSQQTYDDWISSDTEEILLERSDFQVRLADTRGRRNKSSLLINRMYSWRGYKRSSNDPSQDVNRITLQACHADTVFGTLTVAFDSHAGLAADALYRTEIDWFRSSGSIVCELTRLAVDPKDGSKEVLGALFHLAYIYGGLLRGATDVFIEVNPRHVSFYKRMLDFQQAGECKMCARVDAPAVLLHLDVGYVAEQIARYGGHRGRGKRSLYPYFFSKQEEAGLARRVARLAR